MTDKTKHNLKITTIMAVIGGFCGLLGMFGARFVFVTEGEQALQKQATALTNTITRFEERQLAMQKTIDIFLATMQDTTLTSRDNAAEIRSLKVSVDRNTRDIQKLQGD